MRKSISCIGGSRINPVDVYLVTLISALQHIDLTTGRQETFLRNKMGRQETHARIPKSPPLVTVGGIGDTVQASKGEHDSDGALGANGNRGIGVHE